MQLALYGGEKRISNAISKITGAKLAFVIYVIISPALVVVEEILMAVTMFYAQQEILNVINFETPFEKLALAMTPFFKECQALIDIALIGRIFGLNWDCFN